MVRVREGKDDDIDAEVGVIQEGGVSQSMQVTSRG